MKNLERQETEQAIQIISIQIETLTQLPSVKKFIEFSEKRALLAKTLPKEEPEKEPEKEQGDGE